MPPNQNADQQPQFPPEGLTPTNPHAVTPTPQVPRADGTTGRQDARVDSAFKHNPKAGSLFKAGRKIARQQARKAWKAAHP